ncbi:MAG TPA: hypothetical protein VLM40_13415 [Gemmata sp.]|nr:hypothetical protein [Gemmata sp.]
MSASMNCPACKARLKLPPGCTKTKIRCPKCNARMDLAAALSASAYLPTSANLPNSAPAETPFPAMLPDAAKLSAPRGEHEEDPLPYLNLDPTSPPSAETATAPPLSLDEEPAPSPLLPLPPPPFRVAARVTADTAGIFTGPCEVVLVSHGLFLESVPFQPFFYAPVGTRAFEPAAGSIVVSAADGRAVTIEFLGRDPDRLAEDAAAFLAGDRDLPDALEYRRSPPWLLLLAGIFALGFGIIPLVTARIIEAGWSRGLLPAVTFAAAAFAANVAIALFTRLPISGKVAAMVLVGVGLSGLSILTAAAYLAGRRDAPPAQLQDSESLPQPEQQAPTRAYLPNAVDIAYRDGAFRFEDGPADVSALALGPDGSVLIVGYRDGTTRVWRLDQPAIDPFSLGPRSDGPPSRIDFDSTGTMVYMACRAGTVAALWNIPPAAPVKIPGDPFAAFPFPNGERFAAIRGNALVLRNLPLALIKKPTEGKGFTLTTPSIEVQPADVKARIPMPQRPTFLAWHPTVQLLVGHRDGSISDFGETGARSNVVSREHKAAVRVWAASNSTWDFATGDDRGVVGLWENKSMKPRTFTAATGGVTRLAFSPSATRLAVGDTSGAVRVWDLGAERAIVRVSRVGASFAFGPNDDTLLLSDGKHVDLWSLDELAKQP